MNFSTRFFLVFSLSGFLSSVGHYREVTPSLLTRPPRKTSKTNFVFVPFFRTGLQRYALFLILQIFLQNFSNYFLRQSFIRTPLNPFFELGVQRYDFFRNLQTFLKLKTPKNHIIYPRRFTTDWILRGYICVTILLNRLPRRWSSSQWRKRTSLTIIAMT